MMMFHFSYYASSVTTSSNSPFYCLAQPLFVCPGLLAILMLALLSQAPPLPLLICLVFRTCFDICLTFSGLLCLFFSFFNLFSLFVFKLVGPYSYFEWLYVSGVVMKISRLATFTEICRRQGLSSGGRVKGKCQPCEMQMRLE